MAVQPEISTETAEPAAPRHVAIIMDGNGRWAAGRGLPRSAGHKKGAEAVQNAISGAISAGVDYLTLYAFSSENWNRPDDEVKDLMGLLRFYLSKEIKRLHKENIRLQVIGSKKRLADDILKMIDKAESLTADNTRLTLVIALSYGSREEIIDAVKQIADDARNGNLAVDAIDEAAVSERLFTSNIPDPDLIIRTSGEQRLSNFLLWQAAYAEFLFLDAYWPDFSEEMFIDAIQCYAKRDRRYGARP